MTKKQEYLAKPSVGYYSGFGGMELKEIEYGIEDHAIFISNAWYGGEKAKRYCRLKIYYDEDVPYCRFKGEKIPFDEIIRM